MFGAFWFGYLVPGHSEDIAEAGEIMWKVEPYMVMRDTASLELQNPQIVNFGEP
jgi:hypothetical protein